MGRKLIAAEKYWRCSFYVTRAAVIMGCLGVT